MLLFRGYASEWTYSVFFFSSTFGEGRLAFDVLQMRLHPAESRIRKLSVETPARLILFDMLVDGRKLIDEPLEQRRQVLFPIAIVPFEKIRTWKCFDADVGKDSAREIREYFIPDFSNWKDHDSYQKAFGRLLRDLNAEKAEAKTSCAPD